MTDCPSRWSQRASFCVLCMQAGTIRASSMPMAILFMEWFLPYLRIIQLGEALVEGRLAPRTLDLRPDQNTEAPRHGAASVVAFRPMRFGLPVLLLLASCNAPAPVAPELGPLTLREKWVYYPLDLEQSKNVDKLIALMDRSAMLGFNTVLLEDPHFGHLPLMDAEYFKHLDRIKAAAAERRLDLVPAMFQIGHSENLLAQDPNLAEGLPVRDQLFIVRGGVARVEADPPVAFRPAWDHRDESMSADCGGTNPAGKLARVWQKVRVSPY